jgi:hypothetical protein
MFLRSYNLALLENTKLNSYFQGSKKISNAECHRNPHPTQDTWIFEFAHKLHLVFHLGRSEALFPQLYSIRYHDNLI